MSLCEFKASWVYLSSSKILSENREVGVGHTDSQIRPGGVQPQAKEGQGNPQKLERTGRPFPEAGRGKGLCFYLGSEPPKCSGLDFILKPQGLCSLNSRSKHTYLLSL